MEFPITIENQEQLNELTQNRIDRERKKWEKESGVSGELDASRERVAGLEGEIRTRDARAVLAGMNVADEKRQDRIIRLAEIPEDADSKAMTQAFKSLHTEMPEVFGEGATVKDKALDTSQGDQTTDGPLTRERVESMGPEEINSNWDRVKAFLSGERN